MKKRIIANLLIIGSVCLLSGCGLNNARESSNQTSTIAQNKVDLNVALEEEESTLEAIDTEVSENKNVFEYEKLDENSLKMEKEGTMYKFTNETDDYYREVSGKVIFLGEESDILNIAYVYLGTVAPNCSMYYEIYEDNVPESYTEYVLDFEGLNVDKEFENYRDSIEVISNDNAKGVFAKIINNSDKDIKNINLRTNFYKGTEVIYSENYTINRTIKSKDCTFEQVYYNYIDEEFDEFGLDYDTYEIIVDFASSEVFYEGFNEEVYNAR